MSDAQRDIAGGGTPVHRLTRALLWVNLGVVLVAGLSLYALAPRADTHFAWPIAAPVTAAFLGAGYWGSAASFALALRERVWERMRVLFVIGIVLTTAMAVPTLIYLDQFHLGEGAADARAVAWVWLALYLGQPLALLALARVQERASSPADPTTTVPLSSWFRAVVAVHAVVLTIVAVALWPLRLDGFWPWPLPDLGAAAVAVWLLTFATGFWWTLRDGDWLRVRIAYPAYPAALALVALALLRFADALDGSDWRTWAFVAVLTCSAAVIAAGALEQERALRGSTLDGAGAAPTHTA